MIRMCGAELRQVPAVPYKNPDNYVKYSGRLAAELNEQEEHGAIWANQFDNVANREIHYQTTGPEIWKQTEGKLDAFICAVGSGGSLGGIAKYLKEQNSDVKIGLADPEGAALFNYYKNGELKSEGSSITEGIGQGRITANLTDLDVDMPYCIPDSEAVQVVFDLIRDEGLVLGGSSGMNVAGAVRIARDLGPGHTIVTLLCDSGDRYASRLFNPDFLREKKLPVAPWLE
jgi:cysteine synthase A